ncbi:MAG: hypothetical protein P0Y62_12355 [Candidatus Chryseobacterium colombiense]|nr:hypothetical protein [Chryseobacterium sp.]WEK68642.1 MAG: hypothetical protein P0Y62_12355 [Chryseobacterium sp.]
MKQHIFLFLFLIISCKKNESNIKVSLKDETLDLKYEVLNQLITDDLKQDSIDLLDYHFGHDYVYNIKLQDVFLNQINNNSDEPPIPAFGINLDYDSVFAVKDSAYYRNSVMLLSNFKLDRNKMKSKLEYIMDEDLEKIRKNSERSGNFWTAFNKKYKDKCIKTFSVPFFNKDKNICIVKYSMSCGALYGAGKTSVYKKINGKWKFIRSFDTWIS